MGSSRDLPIMLYDYDLPLCSISARYFAFGISKTIGVWGARTGPQNWGPKQEDHSFPQQLPWVQTYSMCCMMSIFTATGVSCFARCTWNMMLQTSVQNDCFLLPSATGYWPFRHSLCLCFSLWLWLWFGPCLGHGPLKK